MSVNPSSQAYFKMDDSSGARKEEADRESLSLTEVDNHSNSDESTATHPRGTRFWLAYSALCILGLAASIDALMITTSLPTILRDLGGGQQQYTWLANSYTLAATAVQPLFGQLADAFGRRWVLIAAIVAFLLGSGVAGGAQTVAQVIAGRAVQGLGAGGIIMLLDLVTCDLVPLRLRPQYLGAVLAACAVGNAIGPLLGGAITQGASWRWIFYINLPVGGVGLIAVVFFLRVKRPATPSLRHIIERLDLLGNALFIASIISIQLGLLFGGVIYAWSSWQTILPIVLGCLGWIAFHFYEASAWCKHPTMPPRLFSNRTSLIGFFLVFIGSMLMSWSSYFLPLYFQIVRQVDPLRSGIDVLPAVLTTIVAAGVAGTIVTKTGRYRRVHAGGFALLMIGHGLYSLFNQNTSTAQWAGSEIVVALGLGVPLTTTLPAIQAALAESDVASSTATYAFVRSFGFVWSVTIPSVILTNRMEISLRSVPDQAVHQLISGGNQVLQVTSSFFDSLQPALRQTVLDAYVEAFKVTWYVAIGLAGLAFLSVFGEKRLQLRTTLETEYGMEKQNLEESKA